jgi:hypothetical protein
MSTDNLRKPKDFMSPAEDEDRDYPLESTIQKSSHIDGIYSKAN